MESINPREDITNDSGDGLSSNMRTLLNEVFTNEVSLESDDETEPMSLSMSAPAPFQPEPRRISRKMAEKIKMGYVRPKRQVLPDTTELTIKHLLNFIPFDRKLSPYIIRKGAFLNTLHRLGYKVSKSGSLQTLLDKLLEVLDYQTHFNTLVRRLTTFQRVFRVFLKSIARRIQGPGIPVSRCVNSECPFTLENLADIPVERVMTWRDGKIYGCDGEMLAKAIRDSISYRYHSTIERMQPNEEVAGTENPFTRQPLKAELIHRCVKFCDFHKLEKLFRTTNLQQQARRVTSAFASEDVFTPPRDLTLRTNVYLRATLPSITRPSTELTDLLDAEDDEYFDTPARNRRIIGRRRFIRPRIVSGGSPMSDEDIPSTHPDTENVSNIDENPISSEEIVERQTARITTTLGQMSSTEEAISENLRSLDFYTPINIMSVPLERTRNLVRHIREKTTSMEHLRVFIQYIRVHMVPLMREAATIFSIPSLHGHFIRASRGEGVDTTIFSQIRRGLYINRIHTHLERAILLDYTSEEVTLLHIQNILPVISALVEFWSKFVAVFGAYFVFGARLDATGEILPVEERRSLAISLISILFHGRFLGQEFEWASMI